MKLRYCGFLVGDYVFEQLLFARSDLLLLINPLATYESNGAQSMAGQAYALAGYAELFLAEDYCAGVTLDQALPGGGIAFGPRLATDSLLQTAIGHFDSALKFAFNNDTVINLVSVGRGRAWLDRGQYDSARAAVARVPVGFVYNLLSSTANNYLNNANSLDLNFWTWQIEEATNSNIDYNSNLCSPGWNVADRDGGVGINYVSANDPRLVLVNGGYTCDYYDFGSGNTHSNGGQSATDSIFYYPIKFGSPGQGVAMPIASDDHMANVVFLR